MEFIEAAFFRAWLREFLHLPPMPKFGSLTQGPPGVGEFAVERCRVDHRVKDEYAFLDGHGDHHCGS